MAEHTVEIAMYGITVGLCIGFAIAAKTDHDGEGSRLFITIALIQGAALGVKLWLVLR